MQQEPAVPAPMPRHVNPQWTRPIITIFAPIHILAAMLTLVGFFLPWMATEHLPGFVPLEPPASWTGWEILAQSRGSTDFATLHVWAILLLSVATFACAVLALRWRWFYPIEIFIVLCVATVWFSLMMGLIIGSGETYLWFTVGAYVQLASFFLCFVLSVVLLFAAVARVVAANQTTTR